MYRDHSFSAVFGAQCFGQETAGDIAFIGTWGRFYLFITMFDAVRKSRRYAGADYMRTSLAYKSVNVVVRCRGGQKVPD